MEVSTEGKGKDDVDRLMVGKLRRTKTKGRKVEGKTKWAAINITQRELSEDSIYQGVLWCEY